MPLNIPFDILVTIIEQSNSDKATLASCARVSQTFYDAAVRSLYREILVTHTDSGHEITSRRGALDALEAHPELRVHVRTVDHELFVSMVTNELPSADAQWAAFLPLLPNLESYTLRSTRDIEDLPLHLLQPISNSLLRCPNLSQARWMFIIHPLALPVVMQIRNLRRVHFGQLAVRSMSLVGQYLKEMPNIEEVAFSLNAITVPKLVGAGNLAALKTLTIGRQHSLSPEGLLYLLHGTPNLQALDVFYDKYSTQSPDSTSSLPFEGLRSIRRLTVRHRGVFFRAQFTEAFEWIAKVAPAPTLQTLNIFSMDRRGTLPDNDFVEMAARFPCLRSLVAPHVRLLLSQFQAVQTRCPQLEYMSFFVDKDAVVWFRRVANEITFGAGGFLDVPEVLDAGVVVRYRRT